jgi:hypothetical protein
VPSEAVGWFAMEQFARDGMMVQRSAVPSAALAPLAAAIEQCRSAPGPHHAVLRRDGDAVFDSDLFRWRDVGAIADLARSPALVTTARALLGEAVIFIEDQWFSADAGVASGSPWHQDAPYYEIDTTFVTCWLTLDAVDAHHSLQVVPGSHLADATLDAVAFDDEQATISDADDRQEPVSHTDESLRTLFGEAPHGFDLDAGDAIWFHARLAHGLPRPSPMGGRRFSLRYVPASARRERKTTPVASFLELFPHGVADGGLLRSSEWFPLLEPS